MSPALRKTLSLRQHEIAKAIGGWIDAPVTPQKPKGVIDEDWIAKANKWWKDNWRCLYPPQLSQPPYCLADTLGLINLKEMADE